MYYFLCEIWVFLLRERVSRHVIITELRDPLQQAVILYVKGATAVVTGRQFESFIT